MSENEMQDLRDAIVDLSHQIQRMSDKQDDMMDDVKKSKKPSTTRIKDFTLGFAT